MKEKPNVEELIADSITLLLIRAQKLPIKERSAITQEFKEWLNGSIKYEDILILDTRIK
tara:strand:- start:226 stop:402 length:177 start_codon:yes stop_codon:yes gene_type:complete